MKTIFIFTALTLGASSLSLRAQIVADGATKTLSNVTNTFAGDVTVGTNGSFTLLVLSDNALLTNSANGLIGRNATAKFNEVRLLSPTARWLLGSHLFVGNDGSFNRLVVSNGATVRNNNGNLGPNGPSSINVAVVTGPGSVWSNANVLYLGFNGAGNQLVVSNGGVLRAKVSDVGVNSSSSNNVAVMTGAGSVWSNAFTFVVGVFGAGDRMVVSDGASVWNNSGYLGLTASSSNNVALVTGPGSVWSTTFNLSLGQAGAGTLLVVSNGGTVFAGNNLYLGADATSINNRVVVDGGTLRTTNSQGRSVFDIRRGTNILNAGLIEADELILTNGAGFLQFNGGTFSVTNSRISKGTIFVIGNGVSPATFLLAGNGQHEFTGILAAQVRSNATFAGNGTIAGLIPLQLLQGSQLAPGVPLSAIGKMVLSNAPTPHGTVVLEISKSGATITNDQIQVIASLTYGGSLVVSQLGPTALAVGDRFPLFNANSYAGGFTNIVLPPLPPGLGWTNKLLLDGSIEVIEGPKFTSITLSDSNIIFAGTGGPSNAPYAVLTGTNVTAPASNWLSLTTNQFDASGNFSFTNPISPGELQRYFRIRTP